MLLIVLSAVRHHSLNFLGVGFFQNTGPAQARLLARVLGREHVTGVRVFEFDLAGLAYLEALGRGSAGPDFRHDSRFASFLNFYLFIAASAARTCCVLPSGACLPPARYPLPSQ